MFGGQENGPDLFPTRRVKHYPQRGVSVCTKHGTERLYLDELEGAVVFLEDLQ